jgi:hypothetical protein
MGRACSTHSFDLDQSVFKAWGFPKRQFPKCSYDEEIKNDVWKIRKSSSKAVNLKGEEQVAR